MPDKDKIFLELLHQYTSGIISPGDHSLLLAMIVSGDCDELLGLNIEESIQSNTIEGAGLPPHRSQEIMHNILSSEKYTTQLIPKKTHRIKIVRWLAAAVVIGIVAMAAFVFNNNYKNAKPEIAILLPNGMEEKINTLNTPMRVKLEEGSVIVLQPKSSIHYSAHFAPGKREVYLEGGAFFEVSKNPARPFFVYNNHIVTRVLGTSFNIKTNAITKLTEVSVRTGRVQVYENTAILADAASTNNGVILMPNQKVIYAENTRQFDQTLVDSPIPVINENKGVAAKSVFVFEDTKISTLLNSLEKIYGIEIIVENENIYNCLFTGDISQQNLYSKLDVVCEAIKASYEIKGTKIFIKGNGCN